jgi:hypothetical protein
MRWDEHVAGMREKRNACRILLGKSEGKGPLWRSRCRWVNNIKMDLRVIVWSGIDRIDLAQDKYTRRALMNTAMNLLIS